MEFANKEYLFLLLLAIPYIIWYVMYRKKSEPTMRMSDTFAFRYAPKSWKVRLMPSHCSSLHWLVRRQATRGRTDSRKAST